MTEAPAPIIVTAELGRADQAWADALRRRHYPPERNQIAAHVSLFHHLPPSVEDELRALLKALSAEPKPPTRIAGIRSLGGGVAIDLQCPDLLAMRERIAERFSHHLTPQDQPVPRLHITVQNKVDARIAKATLAELRESIVPRPIQIAGLACWHYRGGPWSPIAHFVFRG
jgi:plasmid stability protein